MELLLLACIVYVSFQAGKHWGYYKLVKTLKEVADEQGVDLEKELGLYKEEEEKKNIVRELNVEQHGDVLYLFDKETDQFICQGSSVLELAEIAKKQKNVLYAVVKHGDKIFAFKDGISVDIEVVKP